MLSLLSFFLKNPCISKKLPLLILLKRKEHRIALNVSMALSKMFQVHCTYIYEQKLFVFSLVSLLLNYQSLENRLDSPCNPAFTCSKSTMETPEQCVKYVQS